MIQAVLEIHCVRFGCYLYVLGGCICTALFVLGSLGSRLRDSGTESNQLFVVICEQNGNRHGSACARQAVIRIHTVAYQLCCLPCLQGTIQEDGRQLPIR